jgi:hypothetical protein
MSKKQIENKATDKSELAITDSEKKQLEQLDISARVQNTKLSIAMLTPDLANITSERVEAVRDEYLEITKRVQSGDMADMEALLVGQALSLQAMFTKYGGLINANTNNLKACQAVFNMAMKAQAQSRATVQALVELKYPKSVVITKQANISHGHQQVNNGVDGGNFHTSTRAHARAQANAIEQNELLRSIDNESAGERMDTRKTGTHGATDKGMATVATQHRRKNGRG